MKNIGKRRDGPEFDVELTLRGSVASALINAAFARNMRPIDLLANVIEMVCQDDMFNAVLDDADD
jgi:hypothetical protein